MIRFPIIQFWAMSYELTRLEKDLEQPLSKGSCVDVKMVMDFAEGQFIKGAYKTIDLGDAAKLPLFRIRAGLQKFELTGRCPINLKQELEALRKGIEIELGKLLFTHIPAPNDQFFDQEKLFGDEVFEKLKNANQDLKNAGTCLAASLPTASVFHLMRVAEFGLRNIARKIGVQLKDKGKPQPIEFATWGKVIDGINKKIAIARALPHGSRRNQKLQLYSDAAEQCTYIRDIWRNEISHTGKNYSSSEAIVIMSRVQGFMELLARETR